ncbi:2-dehydro-3-deoxygluconokinase [Asanoa ishikariensis]|uniref:2-dehydro-3-deoxygluconokinase n=1 Tax=Asanoa ishikariensis TaxID=137265 RepID=A0A1H3UNK9_9ACTN|nr:sugar kinase [Asanoa ishikariensis]GIF69037.1 2-dehydro-3-deoxygluconokinase [Asanoa ishikariensis]SDZ63846.1 2-dehydro-3-deoxygluconokinase [Asanoa ishikariensis]
MPPPVNRSPAAPDIVGLGEAMVLVQPVGGAPLDACAMASVHVAGAELNLLAAAARAGARAAFCSRVGADPFGRRVLAAATALDVDTDLVATADDFPTGVFFKEVRPDGARRVHYYRAGSAASTMDEGDADRALAATPRLVAVSGLTAALGEGPERAVVRLARQAHARGVAVALDPNLRPGLRPVGETLVGLLPYTAYLVLGRDEAPALFGTDDPAEVFALARAAGVGEVVLKAGADGCFYATDDGPVHLPTAAVRVVDPVGAGDAFAGAYLAARLAGIDTRGAAWLGSQFAAGVVATPGDNEGLPDAARARALVSSAGSAASRR